MMSSLSYLLRDQNLQRPVPTKFSGSSIRRGALSRQRWCFLLQEWRCPELGEGVNGMVVGREHMAKAG